MANVLPLGGRTGENGPIEAMKQITPTEEFAVEYIPIHGHQIGYRRGGQGPVLLLLHGIAGSSLTWVPAMRLLQSDYTVLAPDFSGTGRRKNLWATTRSAISPVSCGTSCTSLT